MKTFAQYLTEINLLTGDRRKHTDLAKAAAKRATTSYQKSSEAHWMAQHHELKGNDEAATRGRAEGSRHYAEYRKHAEALRGHEADARRLGHPHPETVKPRTTGFKKEPR